MFRLLCIGCSRQADGKKGRKEGRNAYYKGRGTWIERWGLIKATVYESNAISVQAGHMKQFDKLFEEAGSQGHAQAGSATKVLCLGSSESSPLLAVGMASMETTPPCFRALKRPPTDVASLMEC